MTDHLTTNHKDKKYDILVVDYLARLDMPGDARFRNEAVKALVHTAQGLTRTFDDGRGLVLLSPIQVNREGHKGALKANVDEGEARYDINAISQVSECLFETDINVKGLPWCKNEHRKIRIGTLTGKLLCRYHNGQLSEVDKAAKQTLDSLEEVYDLYEIRKAIPARSWTIKHFETDMLLLERWCLKTLININLNNQPGYPIEGDLNELVKVAFGLERFQPPKGLYMMAVKGHTINLVRGAMNITTQSMNGKLAGAKFDLWGMPFFLNLMPEPIQLNHGQGHLLSGGTKCWFNTLDRKNREVKSHLLTFTYPKE